MNKTAYYHRTQTPWTYQTDDKKISVILRVSKSENSKINILYGDPMLMSGECNSKWIFERSEMKIINEDEDFKYYKSTFKTKSKRCRYLFEIIENKEINIMGERFWFKNINNAIQELNGFTWGYINKANTFPAPPWYKGINWYQIFIDRFNSSKDKNKLKEKDFLKLENEIKDHSIYGGDIKGVIEKLDYIKELGFNGIYFTPLFLSHTSHKYDTIDYLKIDSDLGTEEDLKKLIEECKKRNIKIMLDAVFNHIGWMSKEWKDVLKNKENSKYKDWFFIRDFNNLKTPKEYYELNEKSMPYEMFGTVYEMPRLNWNNKEVLNYLKKCFIKWTRFGIDGWRLDVSFEPTFNFWREIYRIAMDINPNLLIIGEVWWDSIMYLNGDMWHGVMNYPIKYTLANYFKKREDLKTFINKMNKHQMMYTPLQQNGMFNLLTSHDTPRWITKINYDIKLYKISMIVLYFIQGSTSVFYGEEISLPGKMDPDCRRPMVWDKEKYNFKPFFKKLNEMNQILNKVIKRDEHLMGSVEGTKGKFEYESKNARLILNKESVKVIINNKEFNFE